jgi:hypothetical protein
MLRLSPGYSTMWWSLIFRGTLNRKTLEGSFFRPI